MIENFVPQPYPLEVSTDGSTWELVLGWSPVNGDARPVTATHPELSGLTFRVVQNPQNARVAPAATSASSSVGGSASSSRDGRSIKVPTSE